MRKSSFTRALLCALFVLCLFVPVAQAAEQKQRLVLGSNAANTTQYVMGAAFAQIIGNYAPITIEALPQASVTTLPMLVTGDCDMILAADDELEAAYFSKAIYGKISGGKGFDVRLLMLGTPIAAGFVVAGDSGITSVDQLKGKRVVLDFGTSYALNAGARAALAASGLTEKDVTIMKANLIPDAARMVIEGKADACFGSLGVPAFRELAVARGGARHLGVTDDPANWAKARENYPGYFPMKVTPADAATVLEPITLIGKYFALVSRLDLDDDTAYAVTKILWEHDSELDIFHPDLKTWKKGVFLNVNAPVPYHNGAIRLYKEKGVWTDELQKHNDELIQARANLGKK